MQSSKTTLSYQQRKATVHVTVQTLLVPCMHSRMTTLLVSKKVNKGLVSHGDIRLATCSCLQANVCKYETG